MDAGIDLGCPPFTGHPPDTALLFDGASAKGADSSLFERENQRFQSPVDDSSEASPRRANTGQPDTVADVAVGAVAFVSLPAEVIFTI